MFFLIITIQYVLKGLINAQRQNKEMRYVVSKEGKFLLFADVFMIIYIKI